MQSAVSSRGQGGGMVQGLADNWLDAAPMASSSHTVQQVIVCLGIVLSPVEFGLKVLHTLM